jgi:hypothetical protein
MYITANRLHSILILKVKNMDKAAQKSKDYNKTTSYQSHIVQQQHEERH